MKMLPRCTRFCVSVLIALELCQALSINQCSKPITSRNPKEITINEGEALKISCCGTINFVFPGNCKTTFTSAYFTYQNVSNSDPIYIFEKPKTIYGDTGWYGCADSNVKTITNFSDPEVTWLYVYVTSNRSAFVKANANYFDADLNAIAGDNIDIPCRTTSPNLRPTLIDHKEKKINKASYNSKFGFTISNVSMDDGDSYKCLTEMNGKEYTVNYTLSVHPNETFTEPGIQTNDLFIKPELYLNCTAEMEISVRYVFNRKHAAKKSSSRNSPQFKKHLDEYSILVKSLKLTEVKEPRSNDYECNIKTNYDRKKTKEILISYRQKENITFSLSVQSYYYRYSTIINKGNSISLEVNLLIDKLVDGPIQWFKPNGEQIIDSLKYLIFSDQEFNEYGTLKKTKLLIHKLKETDLGNYMLQIKNQYNIFKNLNVILDFIDKPSSTELTHFESYYPFNETKQFSCEVSSNPRPNITWKFLKCPNYPSLENSTIVNLTDVTQKADNSSQYQFESTAKMFIDVSGKITCEACNEMGCESATKNVLVSDGLGGFSIIGPKEPAVKGDDIELMCAASIYNYTDDFTWKILANLEEQPLVETERLKIVKSNTSFTHRSTLKLYNVQESDAVTYICTGKIINTSNSLSDGRINYRLIIYESEPPHFVKTNMNQTETRIIDINTGQNTTILQCYVAGVPKPKITWYKDNVLLKKRNQYLLQNDSQELHITYLTLEDSGKYSCRAVNRLGTNETYQQIIVKNTKWQTLDITLVTLIPILGFILIISTIYFTIKIHREKKLRKELLEAGLLNFEEGALEFLNPDLAIDEQAEFLPYDKKWEFPRDRLTLREQLGSGNFGVVLKAEAIGILKDEDFTTVAVKMVRRSTDPIYIRALVSELKIMVHLGKHLNVVNLLGACTDNISKCELLMIVEYCHFGNLHTYLLRHRHGFINQIDPKTKQHDFTIGMDTLKRNVSVHNDNSQPDKKSNIYVVMHNCPETNSSEFNYLPDCILNDNLSQSDWKNYSTGPKSQYTRPVCTQDLLSWAFQVARGMEYLSQRKILHGDLAARNILLAKNNVAKICDFGFAKTMYKEENYKKKSSFPMPVKWMAIESIRNRIFSTQSDVWSYGVMLWEFFTLAGTPYANIDIMTLHQKLIEGYRMEQPDFAVNEIYNIMLHCWMAKPTLRPSFTDLVESIGNLLEKDIKMHYITLNNPYMELNMMDLENGKNDYLTLTSAPDREVLSSIYDCENSLPKGTSDSTYLFVKPDPNESEIFNPKAREDRSNDVELSSPISDSVKTIDLSPIPKRNDLFEIDQYM